MESLNYHHLMYFWTVAKEGSVQAAAKKLRLAHPTISGQVKQLESAVGHKFFRRKGRHLELTSVGQVAMSYAETIFGAGQELLSVLRQDRPSQPAKILVGITEAMPKLVVRQLLEPALCLEPRTRVVCEEDRLERLLADLAIHELDVVLADAPVPATVDVKAFNHLLGECSVTLLARADLAAELKPGFPHSLDGAPVILPSTGSALRRSLDTWLLDRQLEPIVIAEIADSALIKVMGADGLGVFAVPTVIADAVASTFRVVVVSELADLTERFYAISTERRIRHPGVLAITDSARERLF
ncbi:MAG: LysR family transcriptional regulator [Deltaproteobacteria bacterium]|nr:LysR family transcriptional regulator [Deltaproteobacteria bacterium]